MRSRRIWTLVGGVVVCLLMAGVWAFRPAARPGLDSRVGEPGFVYGKPPGFVGSAACTVCHRKIAESFARSQMARSWQRVDQADAIERDGDVHDPRTDFRYRIQRRNGRLFVREHRTDEQGNENHGLEVEAKYVIGSGYHGRSYAAEHNGYLSAMPVAWYASRQEWRLSPGNEQSNWRFSRPVLPECVDCHGSEPTFIVGSRNRYVLPLPDGIGCETCHGPGAQHVERQRRAMSSGAALTSPDTSIVNPAALPLDRQQDICLRCHLESDAPILQPGKRSFDFRPGDSLRELRSDFFFASQADGSPTSAAHGVRSMQSKCSTASGGRFTCILCHDSHAPLEAVTSADYNSRCTSCHKSGDCGRPRTTNLNDDCVGCHMPKLASANITHAVTTEHWIKKPPSGSAGALAGSSPQQLETGLPLGFWGNESKGQVGSAMVLNSSYWDKPDLLQKAVAILQEALDERPAVPEWRYRLAFGWFHLRRWAEAAQTLEDLVRDEPQMVDAWELLGRVLVRMGQPAQALEAFESAIRVCPDLTTADNELALLCFDLDQPAKLVELHRTTLRHHPPNAMVLALTAKATLRETKDPHAALRILDEAKRVDPFAAEVSFLEYQIAVSLRDWSRAEKALRGAISANPQFLPAYDALATLLRKQDRTEEAERLFRQMKAVRPRTGAPGP